MSRKLVILLHGVGSNGADLAPQGASWRAALPDTDFACPDAPFPFPYGASRQWFSIDGVTAANRPARVTQARAAFDAVIGGIVASHGLDGNLGRVALVGFSQGSIMALDALARGRWPVAGIVAFSGRLASPTPYTPALETPLLLIHGNRDDVIPATESEQASRTLSAAGVASTVRILPGIAHGISPEGAALAGAFLAESFVRTTGKQA